MDIAERPGLDDVAWALAYLRCTLRRLPLFHRGRRSSVLEPQDRISEARSRRGTLSGPGSNAREVLGAARDLRASSRIGRRG